MKLQDYINKLESGKVAAVDSKQLLEWLKTAKPGFEEKITKFLSDLKDKGIDTIKGYSTSTQYNIGVDSMMKINDRNRVIYQSAYNNELNIEFIETDLISVTNGSDNPFGDLIRILVNEGVEVIKYEVECTPYSKYDYCITCSKLGKELRKSVITEFLKFGFKAEIVTEPGEVNIRLTHICNLDAEVEPFSARVDKFEICVRSLFLRHDIEMREATYDHDSNSAKFIFEDSIPSENMFNRINAYADKYGFNSRINSYSGDKCGSTVIEITDR